MNSSLFGMHIAEALYGAQRILLLGVDMYGTHFFGPHPKGLTNTTARLFKRHKDQFKSWKGCEVINCNPDSHLEVFPKTKLRDII